ncbi:glutathione S-transferase family protein [Arsenicitalea aurantiaca]|uniref:Glutathione S-transferase family protein n=1 Tax=Arsenicitalea aurantiaca TaxID=1783274 RepID=A0A433X8G8_9HYPH|nr:glutathione S-transferase family protein [Arsenicitalea aurantiaca]RUT30352.1 glutathione S-transferase family protein [Arsenicitalea aurantiaca]
MARLLHHTLDPASRLARLMFAEYGVGVELEAIKPWSRDPLLLEINPAATVPILLVEDHEPPVVGALAVIHAIEERFSPTTVEGLFPATHAGRAEVWRLMEWVLSKLNDEVTRYVIEEKIVKRDQRGGTPDPSVLRVAKANLVEHMLYFNWLFATRHWIAGDVMTLADFALAAHLSCLDYLGDVTWETSVETRDWYARIKSRPAFRSLLSDRVPGMPAHRGYADLDF